MRVLVVDDDPRILDVTHGMLDQEGFEVHTTDQPSSVVLLAKELRPDVILLDVRMPEVDGYEALERLKEAPSTSKIPVVLMTARAIMLQIPTPVREEVAGLVTKPFSRTQLRESLQSALKYRGQSPEVNSV